MNKNILFFCLIITCTAIAGLPNRGSSRFSRNINRNLQNALSVNIVKDLQDDEVIQVSGLNLDSGESSLIQIKNVWNNSVRYPLFVDASIYGNSLIVVLELQEPFSMLLRQEYVREDSSWVLSKEVPFERLDSKERRKLISVELINKNVLLLSFLPVGLEFELIKENGKARHRKHGKQVGDLQVRYEFHKKGTVLRNGKPYLYGNSAFNKGLPLEGQDILYAEQKNERDSH